MNALEYLQLTNKAKSEAVCINGDKCNGEFKCRSLNKLYIHWFRKNFTIHKFFKEYLSSGEIIITYYNNGEIIRTMYKISLFFFKNILYNNYMKKGNNKKVKINTGIRLDVPTEKVIIPKHKRKKFKHKINYKRQSE